MIATSLIAENIPQLNQKIKLRKVKQMFLDNCICHLPVVSANKYIGLLSVDVVLANNSPDFTVRDVQEDLIKISAIENQHIIQLIKTFANNNLTALPVVAEKNKYLGTISWQSLTSNLSQFLSSVGDQGIILLKVGLKDYSLSEISNIVESNNCKILGLFTRVDHENSSLLITLVVNTPELKHIMATFERYKYNATVHVGYDQSNEELKERYDLFMKYLDI